MVKSAIAYPSDNVDLPHSLIFIATCRLSLAGKVEEHRLHKIALEPKESLELQRWGVEDADTERGYHASVLLRRLKSPDDPRTQVYYVVSNRWFHPVVANLPADPASR